MACMNNVDFKFKEEWWWKFDAWVSSRSQNEGVVIFSMSDVPLGFGVAAKSTQDCRKLDPNPIVAYHQSDIGEYLRIEDEL